MSDTMVFTGSGELDNGWAITYTHKIDGGLADVNSIKIATDMGDLTFHGLGGSGPIAAWDDVMPSANEESYANVAGHTGPDAGAAGNDTFTYVLPEIVENLTAQLYYVPSDTGGGDALEYGFKYTGVEGLELGFAQGDSDVTLTNNIESTNLYAKYTYDSFVFGVQDNSTDYAAANTDLDFRAYGVSYAVSDEISVSYGMSTVDHENTSLVDQDASAVSFSYVSGGLTFAGTHSTVDNVAGAAATDNSGYELTATFAF
jgi:outer membrane protein OmpU